MGDILEIEGVSLSEHNNGNVLGSNMPIFETEPEPRAPILNLTQHTSTPQQVEAGVVDVPDELRDKLQSALTVGKASARHVRDRALEAAILAGEVARRADIRAKSVMIGGHPALMAPLERALLCRGFDVCYAFSRRESRESLVNGEVLKISVFSHLGFITRVSRESHWRESLRRAHALRSEGQAMALSEIGGGDMGYPGFSVSPAETGVDTIATAADYDCGGWAIAWHDPRPADARVLERALDCAPGLIE